MHMNESYILAPKYMKNFHCIGGACESSCCQWWRIDIDRQNYKELKRVMDKKPNDREKFRRSVKRNRAETNNERYFAKIVLDGETAFCPFVDQQGLCEIHRRFGDGYLCLTCRTYPRIVNDIFGSITLGAVLSCPEVARKCLLEPDSTSLVTFDPKEIKTDGLALAGRCNDPSMPYNRYIDDLRQIFFEFLSARQYPIVSRLFFLAYLSHRISPFFNHHIHDSDFNEDALAAEVTRLSDPNLLQELSDRYQTLEASMELPLKLINSILSSKEANPISGNLFQGVFKFYGLEEDAWTRFLSDDKEASSEIARDVIGTYRSRRDKMLSMFHGQIEIYWENFCKNHCINFLYTDFPNVSEFVESMIFRLTIGSFIMFSHPEVTDLVETQKQIAEGGLTGSTKDALDSIAVESFFKFSRCIEHDKLLWTSIHSAMKNGNLSGLPYMVQLLKFIA